MPGQGCDLNFPPAPQLQKSIHLRLRHPCAKWRRQCLPLTRYRWKGECAQDFEQLGKNKRCIKWRWFWLPRRQFLGTNKPLSLQMSGFVSSHHVHTRLLWEIQPWNPRKGRGTMHTCYGEKGTHFTCVTGTCVGAAYVMPGRPSS
jgi:hypothetical protein